MAIIHWRGNHLFFEIETHGIRDATAEEILEG